jgi:hypothetical protein
MEQLPTVEIAGPYQTRAAEWPAALSALGDALEAVLATGVHDLPGIVAGLNAAGCRDADGTGWSEASFRRRMAELGR